MSRSIGRHLVWLSVFSSGTALLAASLALLFFQLQEVRSGLERRLESVAELIAFNIAAAVDFNDHEAAEAILGSLKTRPEVSSARVIVNGRVFAQYRRNGAAARASGDHQLTVHRPIGKENRPLGTLFVRADLDEYGQTWRRFAVITCLVAIPAVLLAILISQLPKRTFNQMLAEIEEGRATLEQRVADRTSELAAANRELEAFSYSVSHDLRAPLRAIDGFSNALLSEYAPMLDQRAAHFLERVRAGTQKMSQLIDDMIHLARVTRRPLERGDVDVTAVACDVAAELARRNPERHVNCIIEPGMRASADSHLLSIVFENLLGNAWKFTAIREDARVEVGQTSIDGQHAFFVRDNGAGFDPVYASKLFGAFQRLHDESTFEGTGIGLATVKRIITRHGGVVSAEGVEGVGATFFFTLGGKS